MACSCHVLMSSLDPQAGPVVKPGDLTAVRNEDIGQ